MELLYQFSSSVAVSNPGSGFLKMTSADPKLATSLLVHETDKEAENRGTAFHEWEIGKVLTIWGKDNPLTFHVFRLIGIYVDVGTWGGFAIEHLESVGTFKQGEALFIYGGYTESPRLERMLQSIPPFYRNDPTVRGLLNVEAKELDRLEGALNEVQRIPFPELTDDFLSLWEEFFDLPIEPEEFTLAQRRDLVMLEFQRLAFMTYGSTWEERMGAAIGGEWSHEEDEGIINIIVPLAENSTRMKFIANYARQITPAAWEIHVFFQEGFILGISELGIAELR